jgi:hypothetical protein
MIKRVPIFLGVAVFAGVAWSQEGVSMALDSCREIITDMPYPGAPLVVYRALPTNGGMVIGAGWSGHVNSWFQYMRSGGGPAKYLNSRRAIEQLAPKYEQALVEGAQKVAAVAARPNFRRDILALNQKASGKVLEYVKAYDARGADGVAKYGELRATQSDLMAARQKLVAVQRDYDAFVNELARANTKAEIDALFKSANDARQILGSAVEALRLTSEFIPLDPVSAVKATVGVAEKIIPLLLEPGAADVARLEASLAELDAKLEEHRRKAFTARITEASHQIDAAQERLLKAARDVARNRLQMADALQQLAALEPASSQFKYFGAIWEYYRGAAIAGADLSKVTREYFDFLTRDRPRESALLLTHIQYDADHVRRYGIADPTGGQWQDSVAKLEQWLQEMFIPWRARDMGGASKCLRALKEFQHLRLADDELKAINEEVFNGPSQADYEKIGLAP